MEAKEVAGENTHFVLVHGGCYGAWCWYKLLPLLRKEGHGATAIDLSSCGIHPMDAHQIQTWSDINQPLIELFNSLPPHQKVILVGHSVGGMTLRSIMKKFPKKIRVIVFVTSFMPLNELFTKINVLQENAPQGLIAQKQEHGVEMIQKVLDMRGLQERVLTNLENLNIEMKAINDLFTGLHYFCARY